jgi:CO dehydrogenase nickel-insertion accessory protein CooC1
MAKGFEEPFHPKTTSGRILRKIVNELKINPIYFDLWRTKEEENSRKLSSKTKKKLHMLKKLPEKIDISALSLIHRYLHKS